VENTKASCFAVPWRVLSKKKYIGEREELVLFESADSAVILLWWESMGAPHFGMSW
jgi:hypothetical protein